jgi:mRNA interferase RelE/StbE
MEYQIEIIPLALELLATIKDRREQEGLSQRIEKLKQDPNRQGKALTGSLKGYRSVRALGQRYRIVYRVDLHRVVVVIVGVGIRKQGDKKDIYNKLKKLLDRT